MNRQEINDGYLAIRKKQFAEIIDIINSEYNLIAAKSSFLSCSKYIEALSDSEIGSLVCLPQVDKWIIENIYLIKRGIYNRYPEGQPTKTLSEFVLILLQIIHKFSEISDLKVSIYGVNVIYLKLNEYVLFLPKEFDFYNILIKKTNDELLLKFNEDEFHLSICLKTYSIINNNFDAKLRKVSIFTYKLKSVSVHHELLSLSKESILVIENAAKDSLQFCEASDIGIPCNLLISRDIFIKSNNELNLGNQVVKSGYDFIFHMIINHISFSYINQLWEIYDLLYPAWSAYISKELKLEIIETLGMRLIKKGEKSSLLNSKNENLKLLKVKKILGKTKYGKSLFEKITDEKCDLTDNLDKLENIVPVSQGVYLAMPEYIKSHLQYKSQYLLVKTLWDNKKSNDWYFINELTMVSPLIITLLVQEVSSRQTLSEADHYVLASIYYIQERYRECIKQLLKCISYDSLVEEYWCLLAFCLRHLGNYTLFEDIIFFNKRSYEQLSVYETTN